LAFCLDIDGIRCLIGGWDENEPESGQLARRMALAMTEVHLSSGHDVTVPQMAVQAAFIRQLADIAARANAAFHEVVLWAEEDTATARFEQRARDDELWSHHRAAARMIDRAGGFRSVYREFGGAIRDLPGAIVLEVGSNGQADSYRQLLDAIDLGGIPCISAPR
jgi:hypothetical protein